MTEYVVGNMFIVILAGHETTAHTLAFALTLLALYPEQQQLLFEEANEAIGGRTSSYDDYSSLVSFSPSVCCKLSPLTDGKLFPSHFL